MSVKTSLNCEIVKACVYCEHGVLVKDNISVLCDRKGIVKREYVCRRFLYDPLKRIPQHALKVPDYTPEDFVL